MGHCAWRRGRGWTLIASPAYSKYRTSGPQRAAWLWMGWQVADCGEQYPNSDDDYAPELDRHVAPQQLNCAKHFGLQRGHVTSEPAFKCTEVSFGRQVSVNQGLGVAGGLWARKPGSFQALGHLRGVEWDGVHIGTLMPL